MARDWGSALSLGRAARGRNRARGASIDAVMDSAATSWVIKRLALTGELEISLQRDLSIEGDER